MLAPKSSAGQTLPAEHCRYGAMDLSSTDVATGNALVVFENFHFPGIYCTVTVTVSVFVMAPEVAVTVMM
jgi:hypothetical protein